MKGFGFETELTGGFEEGNAAVTKALEAEGFGVLTQIDVRDTLQRKLGVEFRRYRILGACNPPFAHRALLQDLDVGLMLPCNVVVFETDVGTIRVRVIDPSQTVAAQSSGVLAEVAQDVRAKLARVVASLEPASAPARGGSR
jgi:uncharacterized protein (DUF302 family)